MSQADVRERNLIDPTTGQPRLAHLVAPSHDGTDGPTVIMKARIEGTTVTALCGHVLVPAHDPSAFPNCQRCLDVFKASTGAEDGFRDA